MSRDQAVDLLEQLNGGRVRQTFCREVELPQESGINLDGNITRVFVLNFAPDGRLLPMATEQGRPHRIPRIAHEFQHRPIRKDFAGSRLSFLFLAFLSVSCCSGRVLGQCHILLTNARSDGYLPEYNSTSHETVALTALSFGIKR